MGADMKTLIWAIVISVIIGATTHLSVGAVIVIGAILAVIIWIARAYYAPAGSIYCAKCDQLLGNSEKYTKPCPHCGSNRIKDSKNRILN